MNNQQQSIETILNWLSPGSASHRKYEAIQQLSSLFESLINEAVGPDLHWDRKQRMQFSTSEADSFSYLFAYNKALENVRAKAKQLLKEMGDK